MLSKDPSSLLRETVIAKFPFQALKDKDLTFDVGDEILVEKKRSNGWWIGTCKGKRGYFPHNYVQCAYDG